MSDLFNLMLAASRPFVPFKTMVNGEEFELCARKPSVGDNESLGDVWDKSYTEARNKYDDADPKSAPIFAQINRLDKEKLINYIVEADKRNLQEEASVLHDNKSFDDPEVIQEVKELVDLKKESLKDLTVVDLRPMAIERRSHFYALAMANEAVSRQMACYLIYDKDKKPLFVSPKDAAEFSLSDLSEMISNASKALADKVGTVAPLDSPSPQEGAAQGLEKPTS